MATVVKVVRSIGGGRQSTVTWHRYLAAGTPNAAFFASGNGQGTYARSVTGQGWTNIQISPFGGTAGSGTAIVGNIQIAYGNNTFVANTGYVSTDGVNWTRAAIPMSFNTTFTYINFTNNTFVAVGFDGRSYTSPDGITWTQRGIITTLGGQIQNLVVSNTTFVVTSGNNGFWNNGFFTSPDGITWTQRSINGADGYSVNGWTWTGSSWIVTGDNMQPGRIYRNTNADGSGTWTQGNLVGTTVQTSVSNGAGIVLITSGGAANIYFSLDDGATWSTANRVTASGSSGGSMMAFGNGVFVVLANLSISQVIDPTNLRNGRLIYTAASTSSPAIEVPFVTGVQQWRVIPNIVVASNDGTTTLGTVQVTLKKYDSGFRVPVMNATQGGTTGSVIVFGGTGSGAGAFTGTAVSQGMLSSTSVQSYTGAAVTQNSDQGNQPIGGFSPVYGSAPESFYAAPGDEVSINSTNSITNGWSFDATFTLIGENSYV